MTIAQDLWRWAVLGVATATAACHSTGADTVVVQERITPGVFLEPEFKVVLPEGVALRPIYLKGLGVTKVSEGFVPKLYNDSADYCSIGYGHLIKKRPCDGSEPPPFNQGLTEPQGSELLLTDMRRAQRAVLGMIAVDLTDGQYAALCDFVFNVGPGKLKTSTLLRAVNARQYDRVPFQFRRWVVAGGHEQAGLKARREREIGLFFDGTPQPKGVAPLEENLSPIDIRIGE